MSARATLRWAPWAVLTAVTDALPPRWRFGHWTRLLGLLTPRGGLPTVPRATAEHADAATVQSAPAGAVARAGDIPGCLLVAGALDTGGVETVVAALARGLPAHGVPADVVCTTGGRVADDLRAAGVRVDELSVAELARRLSRHPPAAVQLHRIDEAHLQALAPLAERTVLVLHAVESYFHDEMWAQLCAFAARAAGVVAVSDTVREFFAPRLGSASIEVVVNGVAETGRRMPRAPARARITAATGIRFAPDDIVVVGLQRYSDQKNPAGLVDAFLAAAEQEPRLRLLLAGAPDSGLEVRRAEAVRRGHPAGARVHLLGDSDPDLLLAAGSLYALDSFAEGGPVSAIEAVAAGLPVVLSDVGLARRLVTDPRLGRVVPRANTGFSQRDMARQRRRRHQSNRDAFARGILTVARECPSPHGLALAAQFTRERMIAAHAAVLTAAARRRDAEPSRSGRD
ncbi:glycosyltransferase [Microbacterium luticocti]|uniref:glycosyltransferase n=1 Tax=Microbacterium luticocti TaxID=451764 RepID=UPI0003FC92BF|nr:glycosyltransferase [Microbacterium luticocti]